MSRYSTLEAGVRFAAGSWAASLLIARPDDELVMRTQEILEHNIDAAVKEGGVPLALIADIDEALRRDDEDTDETARLIFGALAK